MNLTINKQFTTKLGATLTALIVKPKVTMQEGAIPFWFDYFAEVNGKEVQVNVGDDISVIGEGYRLPLNNEAYENDYQEGTDFNEWVLNKSKEIFIQHNPGWGENDITINL